MNIVLTALNAKYIHSALSLRCLESAAKAKVALIDKYQFTENQATAIIDMKLGKLAGLEKIEIQNEKDVLGLGEHIYIPLGT